jgi:thymidylate kinase
MLLRLFQTLEQANIRYCLMRDADRLDQLLGHMEIDLLVEKSQFTRLCSSLSRLGFLSLPKWGYAPHVFFIAYDRHSDSWIKLDVVTEVVFGKPIHALRTRLAENCLRHRRQFGPVFGLALEDELVTLLLHCVLDKGRFEPVRSQRLKALRDQVTEVSYLSTLLRAYWSPTMTWPWVAALIDTENWGALLAERETVAAYLARRDQLGVLVRRIAYRALRKLNRGAGWLRPQALTVALLAPDGAGKSTLAKGVQTSFYFPVRSVYMGLYQKGTRAVRRRIPGLGFVSQLITQWWRYLAARYHQACGRLVIFDRYTFDALLPPPQRLSWLGRFRRWSLAHACPAPDLVLVLDAPGEVLYARKGEHSVAFLEQQRQRYLEMQAYLPQTIVVDATRGAEDVRREAMAAIWGRYINRLSRN